jgi:hypothetical protein
MEKQLAESREFTEEMIMKDLEKFVFFLAHKNDDPDVIGMEFDDLVQELHLELVKGYKYYEDRNFKRGQFASVLRSILDNRIGELRHKYYGTYRKSFISQISLDVDIEIVGKLTYHKENPVSICDSSDRVSMTRALLSDISKEIFDAVIIKDSEILVSMHEMNADRRLKYGKVAGVLGMSEKVIKSAFLEIRNAYMEVCSA